MSSNSSDSSAVVKSEGNTKQIPPAVKWVFTLNNYKNEHLDELKALFKNSSKYYIFGFEIGENGTAHLQGYVEFKKKVRPKNLLSFNNVHWEKAKGNRLSNHTYCSKDGHYICNGIETKPIKIISELYPWQQEIYNIIEKEPDDRLIYWVYEKQGNVGKTALLKYIAVKNPKTCLVLCGKANDMKYAIIKFYEKNGYYPSILLFNLPRAFDCEYLSLAGIEEIKDGMFYCGKYEGGMCLMNPPHVIICSNTNLNDITEDVSRGRWKIIKV